MLSGTVDPECRQRQRIILSRNAAVVGGADATSLSPPGILTWADDAPDRQATKALAHATIHPAVHGAAAGRELANSIAMH
jgi:hypothetical protein